MKREIVEQVRRVLMEVEAADAREGQPAVARAVALMRAALEELESTVPPRREEIGATD